MSLESSSQPRSLLLQPGTLWPRLREQQGHALTCGALQPLPTDLTLLQEGNLTFLVRVVRNLARKEQAKVAHPNRNPFLPYDPDLFVTDISTTHLGLLNKFNVVDHHLLIVTRAFESQESLLTLNDFLALWACLSEVDGLGFYNSGSQSGASQPHKHLQMVPWPLAPQNTKLLLDSLLSASPPALPFAWGLRLFPGGLWQDPQQAAAITLEGYHQLRHDLALLPGNPYNLLIQRQGMMMVPRSQEAAQGLSVNALGFAGALLVRNSQQLDQLVTLGPLALLTQVGIPRQD